MTRGGEAEERLLRVRCDLKEAVRQRGGHSLVASGEVGVVRSQVPTKGGVSSACAWQVP